uniref:WLM domain-containing protein n=1 Tax=viral metagenome TaxID=1070528 RepID=A0A6C0HC01_9ZZZZ
MFKFKENILCYVIIGFILIVCLRIYYESENYNLKCIISTVDGNKYCVRDRALLNDAADLLAQVTQKMKDLVSYMKKKYPGDPDVDRLVKGFNPKKISETLPTSELTAYSENKGEKLAFCLNKTKNGQTLIDLNTLTFVAIHELAHIMTKSIGHKQEFWQNFKFLLENAKEAGIYTPEDYKSKPQSYCGMTITDNPYYDL